MRQNRIFRTSYCLISLFALNLIFSSWTFAQKEAFSYENSSVSSILGVTDCQKASTTLKSKKEILSKIPFKSLSPYAQEKIRIVLKNISMYRRLPVEIITCEKELYDFMTFHPDTMVSIWRLMGVSQMELQESSPGKFILRDQAGTEGLVEVIHRTENMLLIYADGAYEGVPFPKKVTGRGLIILQNQPMKGNKGENLLAIRLDAFMQIENNGVEALAKTFQPLVGRVADHNLNQVAGFLGELSQTTIAKGGGVANLAKRLEGVTPEVRMEFAEVALLISSRYLPKASGSPLPLQTPNSNQRFAAAQPVTENQPVTAAPWPPASNPTDIHRPIRMEPESAIGNSASILQR